MSTEQVEQTLTNLCVKTTDINLTYLMSKFQKALKAYNILKDFYFLILY